MFSPKKILSFLLDTVPITNASGPKCTYYEELKELEKACIGAIVTKTMTKLPREGNPKPRLKERLDFHPDCSINSMGLPNPGVDYYVDILNKLKKPVIASVGSVTDLNEYFEIINKLQSIESVKAFEVNVSCPNIEKKALALIPEKLGELLNTLDDMKVKYLLKIPPFNFDLEFFERIANIVADSNCLGVSAINSLPNCMDIDLKSLTKVIKPRKGYGGFGGGCLLYLALAEVNRWYSFFKEHGVDKIVIGVGGITKPEAALKHFLAGASAVQIGTWYMQEGIAVFEKVWNFITNWLKEKGFSKVEEIIGIVKDL